MDDVSFVCFNRKAMNKMEKALHELNEMDDLAAGDSPIHHLSPLAKLLTTIAYIIITVSFHKYDLSGLMIMVLWPILLFSITGIPVRTCFYKLRIVLPLVMAVGLFNPFFDQRGITASLHPAELVEQSLTVSDVIEIYGFIQVLLHYFR